eukprot:Rmarinus@m.289
MTIRRRNGCLYAEEDFSFTYPPPAKVLSSKNLKPEAHEDSALDEFAFALIQDIVRAWYSSRNAFTSFQSSVSGCIDKALKPSTRPPPSSTLSVQEKTWVVEFQKELASCQYSESTPLHRAALRSVWDVFYPGEEPPEGLTSRKWKKAGFQYQDPRTDLRGLGVTGLTNLLYLNHHYPNQFSQMSNRTDDYTILDRYPVAISSFNVAMMIMNLMGCGIPNAKGAPCPDATKKHLIRLIFSSSSSPRARVAVNDKLTPAIIEFSGRGVFEELFCMAFFLLHEEWIFRHATYMQFPDIISYAREKFMCLIPEIKTVDQLVALNRATRLTQFY